MRGDIFVTNHNDFHHSDRFDGVDYEFPPKERVVVSVEAATHMFGFNLPDKSGILSRLGWTWKVDTNGKIVEDTTGVKKLAGFVFTRAVMVEEQVSAPPPEPEDPLVEEPPAILAVPIKVKPKGAIDFLQSEAPLV